MAFPSRRQTRADKVRNVAQAALNTALDDGKRTAHSISGLTGARAVATGAALYTAGRAVVTGGRFVRHTFGGNLQTAEGDIPAQEVMDDADLEAAEDAEYEEDEYYDEPEAEDEDDDRSRPRRRSAGSVRR